MEDYTGTYRTLLSLFDYTGTWFEPFYKAGWNVIQWDIQIAEFMDINLLDSAQTVLDQFEHVDGIIAAVPCTDFACSGARWFKAKDESGQTEESIELVRQVMRLVDLFKPTDYDYEGTFFWAIENPVGRLQKLTGLPVQYYFQPYEFADWLDISEKDLKELDRIRAKNGVGVTSKEADLILRTNTYTKKTGLWGSFNDPEKKPIPPVKGSPQGSVMQRYGGKSEKTKNIRSVTPEGFAKAFYEANKNRVWESEDIFIQPDELQDEEIEIETEKKREMKYKIKGLIDSGLDIFKLPKENQEDIQTIATLSDNYTSDNETAHELDKLLVSDLESEGLAKVVPTPEKDSEEVKYEGEYSYMMLGRYKSDAESFINSPTQKGSERNLYFGNVNEHISEMKKLWNVIPETEKPEWLSYDEILDYEKQMISIKNNLNAKKSALVDDKFLQLRTLFDRHVNNGGDLSYPEKDYTYVVEDLENIEIGWYGITPDGSYMEELAEQGYSLNENEAIEMLETRISNTKEAIKGSKPADKKPDPSKKPKTLSDLRKKEQKILEKGDKHGESGHFNTIVRDQDSYVTGYGKHDRITVGRDTETNNFDARIDKKWNLGMPTHEQIMAVTKEDWADEMKGNTWIVDETTLQENEKSTWIDIVPKAKAGTKQSADKKPDKKPAAKFKVGEYIKYPKATESGEVTNINFDTDYKEYAYKVKYPDGKTATIMDSDKPVKGSKLSDKKPAAKYQKGDKAETYFNKAGISASNKKSKTHSEKRSGIIIKVTWDESRTTYVYNLDYAKGFSLVEEENITKITEEKKPAPSKGKELSETSLSKELTGKKIYFMSDDKNWIQGTIIDVIPRYKNEKDAWRIEFYPTGGKSTLDKPLVSNVLSSEQIEKVIDGEEVKGYTIKKPKSKVISDFEKAAKEIDECLEKSKTERALDAKNKNKPPKKQPKTVFADKTESFKNSMESIAKSQKPDKATEIRKIIDEAERKIKKILFS